MLSKHTALRSNASRAIFRKASTSATPPTLSTPSSRLYQKVLPIVAASLTLGFVAGRQSVPTHDHDHHHHLPNGLPRTCCDAPELTEAQVQLHTTLKRIVGKKNVLDGMGESTETAPYLKGARLGKGKALYIVKPTKLKQLIEIVQAVVDADCCVLVQGSNTGLTGGSVPRTQADNRPTVVVSMKALDTIFPIDNGERVVCLAGVGLGTLAKYVGDNFPGRESHSILGSTFLNPTTAAGLAFGSGGTQMRKGPAYSERALYLKVVPDKFGKQVVKVVNTLGIEGFDVEEGEFDAHLDHAGAIPKLDSYVQAIGAGGHVSMKKSNKTCGQHPAHDIEYKERLCDDTSDISRFNADTRGFECCRSEGKVMILASVHDTFAKPEKAKTFWMSFNTLDTALQFRRKVCLDNSTDLPVSVEYMDRDSYDVIDASGRVMGNMIKYAGTSSSLLSNMWAMKLKLEALPISGAATLGDKILYYLNGLMPAILPASIDKMGKERDHHIAMTVGDFEGSLDRFMERLESFKKEHGGDIAVHECVDAKEVAAMTAFRFVAAPAFRTYCVGSGIQGISVDYALPKNGGEVPALPSGTPLKRMRYSHFGCNVVHEDIAFPVGVDVESIKYELKKSVEQHSHGMLPAEHGHGTEYHAPPETQKRWMKMDPLNVMNPGVGGLSTEYRYGKQ
eukprot:Nitzschia sp. Nitz4//scaffold176_size46146//8139//10239//NITZ4_007188-RA/size46146-augustus-gene-0.0-mRNA-1//1//CDS//3329539003//6677//frame0